MNIKIIGAVLIISCCAGFGFSISAQCRREVRMLENLRRFVSTAQWELQYRLTPLPELVRTCCKQLIPSLKPVLLSFADFLEEQIYPQASDCMNAAVHQEDGLPIRVRHILHQMGQSMGRFALEGQLEGLKALDAQIEAELMEIHDNRISRIKSYQALSLSAGAALAILLL